MRELGDPPMIAEKLKQNNDVTSICPRESRDPPAIDCFNVFRTFQGQSQKEKVKYKISKKWRGKYWCRGGGEDPHELIKQEKIKKWRLEDFTLE